MSLGWNNYGILGSDLISGYSAGRFNEVTNDVDDEQLSDTFYSSARSSAMQQTTGVIRNDICVVSEYLAPNFCRLFSAQYFVSLFNFATFS